MAELSEAKLEKIAARAARKVQDESNVRSKILEEGEEEVFDLTSDQDLDAFNDSPPDEGEAAVAYDIFDDMEGRVKKGHQIQYMLKRNGEMITVLYHPYSWEQIQRKYKGGQYQVIAKSLTTKRYIKSETRMLADPTGGAEGYGEASPQFSQAQIQQQIEAQVKAQTANQQQAPSFMELFSVMNSMSEKSKQAEKESSAVAAQSNQQFMMAFIEMSRSQSTQSQQMMLEIAKMTQAMSDKMAQTTTQMFEKMESRFEKIIDKLGNKKDDGISPLDLLKLQNESQDKGFKLFNQLSQIAEAKAQEKVEMMEEMEERFGGKGAGEKKSMTDTLIETMLPTISSALLQSSQGAAKAAPQIPQQQRRALPRAANPSNQGQRVNKSNTAIPRANANANKTQASNQGAQTGATQASASGGETGGQSVEVVNNVIGEKFGLGSVAIVAETSEPIIDQDFDQTHFENVTDYPELDQAAIVEALAPVIGECLMSGIAPAPAATACIEKLKAHNVGVKKLLSLLSHDDMMKLVATYNLPPEANPWFNEVYANFQNISRNAVG